MANPTTNYGWQMPTPTDLVTDLPADFEVFGQAVDTSLLGLKGGTTGQVLSKTSGTDMAFTWATDTSGIPATIVDAKGDLIAATAADAVSRLAVGANDTVLTADSTTATGLKWAAAAAGGGMTLLSTTTLSGSTTTISSISADYKNLQLIIRSWKPTSNALLNLRLNGDTGTNYIFDFDGWFNTKAFNSTSARISDDQNTTGTFSVVVANFIDYANTTTWKAIQTRGLTQDVNTITSINFRAYNVYWNSINAITSITLMPSAGNMTGTAYLYGVS